MNRLWIATLAALISSGAHGQATGDPRLQAMVAVHRQDQMSAAMVQYCQARAPAQAAALKTSWAAWRERQALDLVTLRLQRSAPQALTGLSSTQLQQLHARMERAGPAPALCSDLQIAWSGAGTDLRSRYPIAFAPEAQPPHPDVAMAGP